MLVRLDEKVGLVALIPRVHRLSSCSAQPIDDSEEERDIAYSYEDCVVLGKLQESLLAPNGELRISMKMVMLTSGIERNAEDPCIMTNVIRFRLVTCSSVVSFHPCN